MWSPTRKDMEDDGDGGAAADATDEEDRTEDEQGSGDQDRVVPPPNALGWEDAPFDRVADCVATAREWLHLLPRHWS